MIETIAGRSPLRIGVGISGVGAMQRGENGGRITVAIASDRAAVPGPVLLRIKREADMELIGLLPGRLAHWLDEWRPTILFLTKEFWDAFTPRDAQVLNALMPGVRVLLLGDEVDLHLAKRILRHRFLGQLRLRDSPDTFVRAIRSVMRGDIWLPRRLLADVATNALLRLDPTNGLDDETPNCVDSILTSREAEVADLVCVGLTNKEIATQLGTKEDTIKKHLQHVFRKFGIHRRTLLVRQIDR